MDLGLQGERPQWGVYLSCVIAHLNARYFNLFLKMGLEFPVGMPIDDLDKKQESFSNFPLQLGRVGAESFAPFC